MIKKNPNIRTKAWGPPAWFYITCSLMGYPENKPTKKQKKDYKNFLTLVGETLPCNLCRDSYRKYIKQLPLTDRIMSTRKSLVMWFFKIHNKVNKKLGCKVLTKQQLEKKYIWYEKFRAIQCSPKLGGCLKADKNIRTPKRTKIIMFVDEEALKLRNKDNSKKDNSKKNNNKKTVKKKKIMKKKNRG